MWFKRKPTDDEMVTKAKDAKQRLLKAFSDLKEIDENSDLSITISQEATGYNRNYIWFRNGRPLEVNISFSYHKRID